MKKIAIFVGFAGVILALYVGYHARRPKPAAARATAPAAPAFTMVDLDGNKIDTAAYRGKVVLINFWAAWCVPCAEEIPQFTVLEDKYRAQGFRTIGISMEDKESVLREFYRKHKMNYPVIVGNQDIAQEYGGILGLPTTFLVGRDGRIHHKYAGTTDFAKLEHDIQALLQARN